MNDLILYDGNTVSPTSNVYKYLRGEGDQAVYLTQDGREVTIVQLQELTIGSSLVLREVGRVWGMSLQDLLKQFAYGEILDTLGPGGLKVVADWWGKLVQNPSRTPGSIFMSGGAGSINIRMVEFLRPHYVAWTGPVGPEALEALYPEGQPMDFQAEGARAAGLFRIAAIRYLRSRNIDVVSDPNLWLANPDAWKFQLLMTALEDGDPVDDYISDEFVQPFWDAIQPHVMFRTVEPPEGAPTEIEAIRSTIADNLANLVRQYQALYGDEGKTKMLDYLKQFAQEFDWARKGEVAGVSIDMAEEMEIEGVTGAFPLIWDATQLGQFQSWLGEREKEEGALLSDEEKATKIQANIASIFKIYTARYGEAGRTLAQMAMNEAKAYGSELLSIGDVLTPEGALGRWVPRDVREVYSTLGIEPNEYLGNLALGSTPEQSGQLFRALAVGAGGQAIQSGRLAPEAITTIKSMLNVSIMTAPPPAEGERQFYLTEAAAHEQYRTYLAGALPAGQYRSTAWEYFPQTMKAFPEQHQLGAGKLFQKRLEGLGPTFFSRLTPKPERATSPRSLRLPGGGRTPLT